ncbi:MAG: hypothetical protein KIH69_004610 [Anaerolineae bacterium]|nr:hypothetical protein [Anaerolineae bacterium]
MRRPLTWLPLGITLLVYLGYLLVMLLYARSLFLFPLDYDQGEGFELYDGIRLARGEGIYLDNAQFPFYASNYPPVYRLMLVPLIWLFGPHIWVGRMLTFACTLLIGALIFLNLKFKIENGKLGDARLPKFSIFNFPFLISTVSALAFFAANYVYQIAPLARAHLPMVMFAVAGIACLDRALTSAPTSAQSPTPSLKSLGIALLIIAGFTKLQAVDALAAGFLFALIQQPRWGAKALLVSAVVSGVIVVGLNILTGGQFWLNVVAANVNEYSLDQTWRIYREWFGLQAPLILCASAYVLWDVPEAIRARTLRRIDVWSFYFVAGCAMGMLTGKWGAGPAYLIAAIAAACVLTARLFFRILALAEHAKIQNLKFKIALFASVIFLWQAALNLHLPTSGRIFGVLARVLGVHEQQSYPPYPYYDSIGYTQLGHLLSPQDLVSAQRLVQFAKSVDGPVWSEEAMITLRAGKDVVTNPTQLYNLAKNDALDTRVMIQMINERRFGLVILKAEFYPREVLEAIGKNYDRQYPSTQMNGFDYWLLTPKTK